MQSSSWATFHSFTSTFAQPLQLIVTESIKPSKKESTQDEKNDESKAFELKLSRSTNLDFYAENFYPRELKQVQILLFFFNITSVFFSSSSFFLTQKANTNSCVFFLFGLFHRFLLVKRKRYLHFLTLLLGYIVPFSLQKTHPDSLK